MARRVSLWFARIFWWLFFRCRFYYKLSKIYQKLQLIWAKKGPALPTINNIHELEDILSRMKWRKDGIGQWYDTFEHPKAIWAKYLAHPEKGVEDCDGFAIFGADRITDMIKRGQLLWGGAVPISARVLTVSYRRGAKYGGHNVCLVAYSEPSTKTGAEAENIKSAPGDPRYRAGGSNVKWGYIGNWFSGEFQGSFDDPWQIIVGIAGGDVVGWAVATYKMKLLKHGWKRKHVTP